MLSQKDSYEPKAQKLAASYLFSDSFFDSLNHERGRTGSSPSLWGNRELPLSMENRELPLSMENRELPVSMGEQGAPPLYGEQGAPLYGEQGAALRARMAQW